jgi:hypothetical protein
MASAKERAIVIANDVEKVLKDPRNKHHNLLDEFAVFNETISDAVKAECAKRGIIIEGPDSEKGIYGWRFSRGVNFGSRQETSAIPTKGRSKRMHNKNRLM